MTSFIEALTKELEQESVGTRKMLALVPTDKGNWKPHTKSMEMMPLTGHLADIGEWFASILENDVLDFAVEPYKPRNCNGGAELVAVFDENIEKSKAALAKATDSDLAKTWTMQHGDHIIMQFSKYEALRHSFGQMIHHRAQLGVYLRLLEIPIPGVYGPSADEMTEM